MAEELLYLSDRTQVTRHTPSDGPGVICKHATGAGAIRRVEHERAVLEKLAGMPGVPRLAEHQARRTLVLQDDGGTPPPAGPMPLPDLVRTAHALATTLAGVHRAGVLHRDITPANVVLRPDAPPLLIDFDVALTGAPEPDEGPVGTLGFLAPEQTGRTGLSTDRRTDLYGLGATLYTLATGTPPVTGHDPLELVRGTLVGTPSASGLPPRLGDIIMRLLEKDPDRRYQSAEGLAHDLARWTADPDGDWTPGDRDFPLFLPPPPTLVGRDPQIGTLATALDRALAGDGRAVLVSGPAGIGKSALIQTLRPLIAARGGWFLAGKYEQFRTGVDAGGTVQVIRNLAKLLLALPEAELEDHRERLVAALDPVGNVLSGVVPELDILLGWQKAAEPLDLVTPPTRVSGTSVTLLRTVAAHRPLVMMVDDLQWATSASLRVLDGLVAAGPVPGLLVVCAYRDEESDAGRPLAGLAARWERDGFAEPPLRLAGLDRAGLAELTGAVLRLEPSAAESLADLIGEATSGNPYATVALINGLRAEGLLTPAEDGWDFDPDPVRNFVTRHHLPQLLTARLEQQPATTRRLLVALTCLGSNVPPELLATATATPPVSLPAHLAPAVADGLISADSTVKFCHDLVLQAARDLVPADEMDRSRLAMARRLAAHGDYEQQAAEQYLAVTGLVSDDGERRTASALLHQAGRRAARITNYPGADELLAAADRVLAAGSAADDAIAVDRHTTLYCLGRHTEADRIYHDLAARSPDPLILATATAVQINSLTVRNECPAAIALGLDALRRFGITPPADLVADNQRAVLELRDWVAVRGPAYPTWESTDPRIVAVARILQRMQGPTYMIDPDLHAWLVLRTHTLWQRNGVCEPLTGTLGGAIRVTSWLLDDHRTGYLLTGHALRAAREHGYHAAAVAAYQHLLLAAPWFEPLEEVVEGCWQVRDELLAVGDVQIAGWHWARLLVLLLETEDSLQTCAEETTAVLAFAERTGNWHARLMALGHRRLIQVLRGQTAGPGPFDGEDFDEAAYLDEIGENSALLAGYHLDRALAALLSDDTTALEEHSAAAMVHCKAIRGFYSSALARVTRCLSDPSPATADARDWLARRAADMPCNFRPLLLLVDAEKARAGGDAVTAIRLFDEGLNEVTGRPWHHALLAERAARLHLEQGLTHAGRRLLAEARDAYQAWGAGGPVARLEAEHPFLRNTAIVGPGSGADRLDLRAILRASRALSSKTTLAGLTTQVIDVLCAMTGATDVHLSLRDRTVSGSSTTSLPASAVRYVERTHQPLLVADATRDDRFSQDPYLTGLEACSLLVIPVPCQSAEDAVLVLANRRQRGVFSTSRLQTVELIAGQLAVSLDNALHYDSLENEVRARTAEIADRNRELEAANQLKADLIGMLGHEINNPLATILGSLDLVLTGDPLPPSAERLLARQQGAARRLAGIVEEVLALVSIDAGRLTATPRPVRVADHIEAALGAATTAVTVSCPPDLVAAVQPGHLDQILTNLISNADKYGGGVEAIDVHGSDGGPVTIDVADRGPGVPPEFRDRLFDRFARAENTAGKVAGTGLGLYIVRELARANGGDIRYRHSPAHGSTFVVSLPPATVVTVGTHPDMSRT
ncbi:signal transduction histidine kinase [Actinoplanes campanulatus]|uniref:histidine kinase n=1 Tax=Actinoplanes campanulatus TaxID=113559 RepID=A0A7W5FEU4_9ACTN|nr:AAA family ATPase [Actinoplanes campanulatus]MBB3095786.1 signal transduction histidine kinase [Actinoplanes campanulatus]